MATPVTIEYGSFAFDGAENNYPVPYLSRSYEMVYYADKWCQATKITLAGQVAGTYSEINTQRQAIQTAFASDFKTLLVKEGASTILTFTGCVIRGVSFDPSNIGMASYSIEMDCYESSDFNGTFGVLDPVNEWSFSEGEDSLITIDHSVSARGFSGSSYQAITNAKNFVQPLQGTTTFSDITPAFIGGISSLNLVLKSSGVSINRLDSTYAVNESYVVQTGTIMDIAAIAGVTSSFTADLSSGASEDYLSVGVDYTIQGGKDITDANLRSKVPPVSTLYSIATGSTSITGLNTGALSYSINEDLNSKTIGVKASFNDDRAYEVFSTENSTLFSGVYFDYQSTVDTDLTNDVTTVSINGSLKSQVDGIQNKVDRVSGYYYNDINNQPSRYPNGITGYLKSVAESCYTYPNSQWTAGAWSLFVVPASVSVTDNYTNGEINVSASFSDKDGKAGFKEGSFNVSVKPALSQYSAKASANRDGLYQVYDLNTRTREEVTIGGNFSSLAENSDYRTEIKNYVDDIRNFYIDFEFPAFVTSESMDELGAPYYSIGFNHTYNVWVAKGDEFIPKVMYDKMYVTLTPPSE
jgi:hypothetical protein